MSLRHPVHTIYCVYILLLYAVLSYIYSTACSILLLYRMYFTVFWWHSTLFCYLVCILLHAEHTYGNRMHHMYMYCMQNINTVVLRASCVYSTACSILLLYRMWNYCIRMTFNFILLSRMYSPAFACMQNTHVEWLWLVGSLKLEVSLAEYSLFYRALLQKRHILLRSLLIVATPYHTTYVSYAYSTA